ncbi:putative camp-regulated phospho protein family protein Igo1 [Aspergillus steynii IBT 23096]|uniref:mRNA stability protein n=1 Tax=Aspergillus steynii IBT 23096 TaxID=1392250 RepID=A0A2I2FTT6_9EURO|nr:putative camp-regulated phospho protein family protein Igo1 [Aspergillus steynii IBT 23096]PLB44055.1 putative camp-regulated phospho protein family protein Igo1 [Aspergillus steynii IBT 23096]
MNPHQQNKVDISSLNPDEQRLLRLYGKMPNKKDVLQNKLKERKYFDSGDYALSKAGKASDVGVTNIGSQHPVPENIPHLTATSPGANNPAAASNGTSTSSQGQQIPGSFSAHPGSVGFQSRSPVKEGSYLQRETSAEESDPTLTKDEDAKDLSVSPPPTQGGVPIRQ